MTSDKKRHLQVVEDDIGIQNQLKWCFDDYEVVVAANKPDAIDLLRLHEAGVVLLDLGLPPDPGGASVGLDILQTILELAPMTKVIVVTGNDEHDHAINAIAAGAFDYYQKPIDTTTLTTVVDRAFKVLDLELENQQLQQLRVQSPLDGVIAGSPQMLKVCGTIEKVAPSDVSTLLLGESGTGKELLARALHQLSNRRDMPMVAINCAAIPENLLESELFGYEKGAFTGANKQTQGKIEYANGGTLFLDEVGDMPLELQVKMLRFLQERVLERVGGRTQIPVDVRIITATHKDIVAECAAGTFREDLYYRISEIKIDIPPLRERDGDIPMISRMLLQRFSSELSRTGKRFSEAALTAMNNHLWPGNIREMENRIKRAVIMSDSNQIMPEDLELEETGESRVPLNLKEVRKEAERNAVTRALSQADNNISKAAKLLGVTRPTLYDIMEKYGLKGRNT